MLRIFMSSTVKADTPPLTPSNESQSWMNWIRKFEQVPSRWESSESQPEIEFIKGQSEVPDFRWAQF